MFNKEIRRVKRRHEMELACKVKEIPKRFYRYIERSKRVAKER